MQQVCIAECVVACLRPSLSISLSLFVRNGLLWPPPPPPPSLWDHVHYGCCCLLDRLSRGSRERRGRARPPAPYSDGVILLPACCWHAISYASISALWTDKDTSPGPGPSLLYGMLVTYHLLNSYAACYQHNHRHPAAPEPSDPRQDTQDTQRKSVTCRPMEVFRPIIRNNPTLYSQFLLRWKSFFVPFEMRVRRSIYGPKASGPGKYLSPSYALQNVLLFLLCIWGCPIKVFLIINHK